LGLTVLNTTGVGNVALGINTLWTNQVGNNNTAVGDSALDRNTANNNSAFGWASLYSNTTGFANVGLGVNALWANTEGSGNIAVGDAALFHNTTGSGNIGLGSNAGVALATGSDNVFIGSDAGGADESGTIRIGTKTRHTRALMQGISGVAVAGADPVYVQADGQLGTVVPSSRRFKEAIQAIGDSGTFLQNLRPVSFRYRRELDPSGATQYGLIAEEVAEVAPELVVFSPSGEPEGVRYHLLEVLLVNELQRQYRVNDEQAAAIDELLRRVAALAAAVEDLNERSASRYDTETPSHRAASCRGRSLR
jgi:hypothetical protein